MKTIFTVSIVINVLSAAFLLYATLPKWSGKWAQMDFIVPGIWALGFIAASVIFWLVYLFMTKSWSAHWWLLILFIADAVIVARIWN